MGKNKLSKFAEMDTIGLVFQYPFSRLSAEGFDSFPMKGRWHEFFGNDRPIVLELGCGKGEYTVGMAQLFSDKNFIGIDIKGARMHAGAVKARDMKMPNVAFLRTQIELIEHFFAPGEVAELWITFPDPQMKKVTKRLTGTRFLGLYRKVMADGGIVRPKTDSPFLYTYTRAMALLNGLRCEVDTDDLYHSGLVDPILAIRTHYESQWLARGLTIKYLAFALPHDGDLAEPEDDFERDTYRSYSRGTIDTGILNKTQQ